MIETWQMRLNCWCSENSKKKTTGRRSRYRDIRCNFFWTDQIRTISSSLALMDTHPRRFLVTLFRVSSKQVLHGFTVRISVEFYQFLSVWLYSYLLYPALLLSILDSSMASGGPLSVVYPDSQNAVTLVYVTFSSSGACSPYFTVWFILPFCVCRALRSSLILVQVSDSTYLLYLFLSGCKLDFLFDSFPVLF
jgi:hypothetical protein